MKQLPIYAVGDKVRATTDTIRRYDNAARLYPGGPTAKVTGVFTCEDGTQVIDIQSEGARRIGDLVVTELLPLEKVPPNT